MGHGHNRFANCMHNCIAEAVSAINRNGASFIRTQLSRVTAGGVSEHAV